MKNNTKGFTLLEIIIVIIIVGVLASLALPRLFTTVEFSRSSEAMSAITSIRSSMERCYLTTRDYQNCDAADFSELDIEDPQNSPGNHFTYAPAAASQTTYTITATRNGDDGGDGSSTVVIQQTDTEISRRGTGAFSGVQ